MERKLFNCDEELLELVNTTITNKDNYSFSFEFNDKSYIIEMEKFEFKKGSLLEIVVCDSKSNNSDNKLSITIKVNRTINGSYVYDEWGEHITDYENHIYDNLNIFIKKSNYYSVNYRSFDLSYILGYKCINGRIYDKLDLEDIQTISLEKLQTGSSIQFVYCEEIPMEFGGKILAGLSKTKENKVNTDSTFSDIDNKYSFKKSYIIDKQTLDKYSNDANSIKSLSPYSDVIPSVIPSYEDICSLDVEKETSELLKLISSKYPQYSTNYLKKILTEYFENYKEHFKYLYEDKSSEIKNVIRKRNVMLEERKKAPYLSKEELGYIISQIKEYNNQLVMKRVSKDN